MRVTIGQINTINGDFESNTASIIRAIEQAKKDRSDLVVLPEVSVQGYTSLDWFLDRDVERCALQPLQKIIAATEGLTAIVGTVRPSELITGRRLYNSAAVIRNRKLLGFADKTLLPEYDVFDDPRYFQPGSERHLFTIDGHKLGVAVCEDVWNDKTFWRVCMPTILPMNLSRWARRYLFPLMRRLSTKERWPNVARWFLIARKPRNCL
jgi:NAD+ synthase (glutamine-hydrolysing)